MKIDSRSCWRSISSALSGMLLVAACGGGSGGDGSPGPAPDPSPPTTISLVAGSLQTAGSRDGAGSVAQFNGPTGVVQDIAGNAYVADTGNHTIRKIAPDGTVTTLAGAADQAGITDAPTLAARFSSPRGLAIDAAGSLYAADSRNYTIRKITASGVVSTVAGAAGQGGSIDGPAATARFQLPTDVAVDSAGNLYVVDGTALRKVATDGAVTTFAVQSAPISAVATDTEGNVYAAGYVNVPTGGILPAIRKFSSTGAVIPWGAGPEGSVIARFVVGLSADKAGNVYAAASGLVLNGPGRDVAVREILKITASGEVDIVSGADNEARTVDGPAAMARFRDPSGISVSKDGRVVVTERDSSAVRQISAEGIVTTLAGGSGDGFVDAPGSSARFFGPRGIAAASDGTLYVADTGNKSVRKISPAGSVSTLAMTGSTCPVHNIALSATGTLFVEGTFSSIVRFVCAVDPSGVSSQYADSSFLPNVAVDAQGRVLLGGGSIVRINTDRTRQVLASGFNQVNGIVASAAGLIYVADGSDHTVRAIAPDGTVTLLAGQAGNRGYADGVGANARFDYPAAITVDAAGNLYVADAATIRRITPQGEVRTIAGVAGQSGVQPGPALAPLGPVRGLALFSGALYATVQNAVIRIAPVN